MLAEKICGAAAERGDDLPKVAALCRQVNESGASMGMALTSAQFGGRQTDFHAC